MIKLASFRIPLLYAVCAPLLGLSLVHIARANPEFSQWYASSAFQIFPNIVGRLFSLLPFSALEIGLYLLPLFVIFGILNLIANLFTAEERKRVPQQLLKTSVTIACFASTILLMVLLTCSMNYNRNGIAKDIDIVVTASSHEDLVKLTALLIDDLAGLSTQIQPSTDGTFQMDPVAIKNESKQAMFSLGEKYSSLSGYYPNPKPILMSSWMSNINLTGIFSPYTIEANYNQDVPDYLIPYTICHELAHLRGYIREDEAGFIAYLACSSSDSASLQYSGKLNALSYVLSALYRDSSKEEYERIIATLPEQARTDLIAEQEYWRQHESTASEIATNANDKYLKANAQSDGVKSYGRIVDLLLAYHKTNALAV
ncbi:DUF3810 domain-containing protein [Clostridium aminobutyricum]|uniref:DUF3810 domain-containing protein n=1 Tax=Clostridium aminobutyricum TaxID=33953 RepID=A0A939IGY2_CLOAM|nr:DUF3810 domain-containing protein [Clostridium aminobutyricum]MBN7774145.1 DUF3810 domain-containing protein [Clostridium aminobutyricum]